MRHWLKVTVPRPFDGALTSAHQILCNTVDPDLSWRFNSLWRLTGGPEDATRRSHFSELITQLILMKLTAYQLALIPPSRPSDSASTKWYVGTGVCEIRAPSPCRSTVSAFNY